MKEYKPLAIKKFPTKSYKNNEARRFKRFKEVKGSTESLTATNVKICEGNPNLISYFIFDSIHYYDLSNDNIVTKYPFCTDQISAGNLRSDGRLIYTGLINGKLNVYDANKKSLIRSYNSHKLQVNSIDISSSMVNFISSSNDMVSIIYITLFSLLKYTIFQIQPLYVHLINVIMIIYNVLSI